MAEFCRAQTRQITRGCISLLGVLGVVVLAAPCTFAQTLYKGPVLVTELGMHTAKATAAIDSAGRFIVTGSRDKTVRIWSASNGELLRTISDAFRARLDWSNLRSGAKPRWRERSRGRLDGP